MRIAFVGDVHGCVLHALGAVAKLAEARGGLDAVVQVGDLGAFPSADRWDDASRRFGVEHPAQHDFFRLLDPSPELAEGVRLALARMPSVRFVSGNHEDHAWLAGLRGAVDPLGAFVHVPCGTIADVAGLRFAFLGLIESDGMDYDDAAYAKLADTEPGSVDVLVTHDGPYAMSSYRGTVQGSPKMTALLERLQPRLHVSGHYHHENGPRRYGETVSYCLGQLVQPKTKRGEPFNPRQEVMPGSIGVLDTETLGFEYVHDAWLADVHGDDLDLARLLSR
ncbi:metallophosphoesterase family protein [Actinomadura sediminis]|uniref:Metallophosphoesterase n=1 Tax=Actinomadura sediminis TaxID=1038904 RepID=A0ABW3EMB4_9ACTN